MRSNLFDFMAHHSFFVTNPYSHAIASPSLRHRGDLKRELALQEPSLNRENTPFCRPPRKFSEIGKHVPSTRASSVAREGAPWRSRDLAALRTGSVLCKQ